LKSNLPGCRLEFACFIPSPDSLYRKRKKWCDHAHACTT